MLAQDLLQQATLSYGMAPGQQYSFKLSIDNLKNNTFSFNLNIDNNTTKHKELQIYVENLEYVGNKHIPTQQTPVVYAFFTPKNVLVETDESGEDHFTITPEF